MASIKKNDRCRTNVTKIHYLRLRLYLYYRRDNYFAMLVNRFSSGEERNVVYTRTWNSFLRHVQRSIVSPQLTDPSSSKRFCSVFCSNCVCPIYRGDETHLHWNLRRVQRWQSQSYRKRPLAEELTFESFTSTRTRLESYSQKRFVVSIVDRAFRTIRDEIEQVISISPLFLSRRKLATIIHRCARTG